VSDSKMIINYVPGEECRVAIVEDGKLEELYVEKFASVNRVGNIYVGKVVNVEPAIQAAFIDFGVGQNGFLHVSDLHPRYFPGEGDDTTERVGHKTPRRERPPIQHALRRGDEVIVQVLKDGVGTKGPSVTSYLSIPGRFLVMMPQMDNIGVSRKVEDDDQRRQMREILDALDLPEGFGFILRTAGFQKTKTELKRDLSYLQRLWKDMERRLKSGGNKPRLLYSESDLLVRSLRDLMTGEINEVIIDHESALKRACRFMKIVAPRGAAKLLHFKGRSPVFHAFGIEEQIALIHAREVPLPSGGRLVIDQTEALVAIDVNSGKSRESRDSEQNAYQTNVEAVDEICRQLRLRDMGGIVINDLIDMRRADHRKDIENRFKERLKRDRAKTTVLTISEFGILEMTRQRMRPSHESVHFSDCPTCRGRGMVQKPESVAAEAVRELCMLLDVEKIQRVELVISPRVAGEMLSGKRQILTRIERTYAKKVDVRVSEAVPMDRIGFYAYDTQGNDVDLTNLPRPKKPESHLEAWVDEEGHDWADNSADHQIPEEPEPVEEVVDDFAPHPIEIDEPADDSQPETESPDGQDEGGRRKRRRRGRRGRGGRGGDRAPQQQQQTPAAPAPASKLEDGASAERSGEDAPPVDGDQQQGESGEGRGGRRRRRRRGRRGRGGGGQQGGPQQGALDSETSDRIVNDQPSPVAEEIAADQFALDQESEKRNSSSRPAGLRPNSSGIIVGDHGDDEPSVTGAHENDESDAEGEESTDQQPGQQDQGQGGDRGGRRKRRRRGRRGRGGGGEGRPEGQQNGGKPVTGGGNDNRGNDGVRRDRGRPPEQPKNPAPAPQQAPPQQQSNQPKPRTLYGAVKRKLSASELNRRPKPE